MSHVDTQHPAATTITRPVTLVDCDVHAQATEAMLAEHLSTRARRRLERYGRRTPRVTEWYPRARNAGMRVDAWPGKLGHIWGSDPELTRAQLLDEWLKRPPSEYVKEHFRATTAPAHLPRDAVTVGRLLEMMHAGSLSAYASDYPHDHGDGFSVLLDQLDEHDRSAVLFDNAAHLHGLTEDGRAT